MQNESIEPAVTIASDGMPTTATQTALEQLSALTQISNEPDFDRKLQLIVDGLNQIGWNRVALTLRDENFAPTRLLTAGLTPAEVQYLRENMLPPARWLALFEDPKFESFRQGSIYFVPGDGRWIQRAFGQILPDDKATGRTAEDWHPYDLLTIVLRDRQKQRIGLITLDQPTNGQRPSAEGLQTIELYAQFAASVIENAQLVEQTLAHSRYLESVLEDIVERERFYSALGSMSLAIHYTLDIDSVLNLICHEGQNIFDVSGATIWQNNDSGVFCRAADGPQATTYENWQLPADDKFMNALLRHSDAFFINDIQQQSERPSSLPDAGQIQALLGVPLEQDGQRIGFLLLTDHSNPQRFAERDTTWATMFAVQAAVALRNAQLFAELRNFNDELDRRVEERTRELQAESNRVKILLRITAELSSSLDQGRVLSQALTLVNEEIRATQGVILLIDQETNELIYRATFGLDDMPASGSPTGFKRHEGLAGWVIQHGEPVILQDTVADERWVYRKGSANLHSVMAVPLIAGEETLGVLMLFHEMPNAFSKEQIALVSAAASQVANAISNSNLYLLIRDQAERLGKMLQLEQIESAKSQAILESIADGVLFADQSNRIMLANLPASDILGIPREELLNKPISQLLGLYGQTTRPWLETINQWASDTDHAGEWVFLADQLTIEDRVVSIHLSPVLTGKQFFGTVSIFRDITKAAEVDRLKSEFVSNVSHELRTPMTSIKGYVDLLLLGAGGDITPTQRNYLQVVKNNAQRLQILVNDLLDISRLESGQTKLERRPFNLLKLINSLVESYSKDRLRQENHAVALSSDVPRFLPLIYADEERIRQVLTNLLDNAINYTPDGGSVLVRVENRNSYVQVAVQDTGIGIERENLERIFDRFFRADAAAVQRVPGTGLGLAIVRSLVEMHEGKLTVESEPGKGSTFTFTLPVASPAKLKSVQGFEGGG